MNTAATDPNNTSSEVTLHTKPEEHVPKLTPKQKVFEFAIGFVCGFFFSVYSYRLLPILGLKKYKRIGMFWGCFVSFLIILSVCFSFAAYTNYKHEVAKRNRRMIQRQGRKLVLLTFAQFMTGAPIKKVKIRQAKENRNANRHFARRLKQEGLKRKGRKQHHVV